MSTRERPILFSAPMVRAILAGTKTQTRRAVRPPPISRLDLLKIVDGIAVFSERRDLVTGLSCERRCPYGVPGDRLWVREAWGQFNGCGTLAYRATNDENPMGSPERWRPSIHMPRWASRITLEITGVRVERLQEISEADSKAEGIERSGECNWRHYLDPHDDRTTARGSYRTLWESINGPGSWDANPWVWAVEFRGL